MEAKRFEVGEIYATRSACDWDCIFSFTVTKRTEKTVTIKSKIYGTKVKRIRIYDNVECIDPLGSYSMSPVLSADKTLRHVLRQG